MPRENRQAAQATAPLLMLGPRDHRQRVQMAAVPVPELMRAHSGSLLLSLQPAVPSDRVPPYVLSLAPARAERKPKGHWTAGVYRHRKYCCFWQAASWPAAVRLSVWAAHRARPSGRCHALPEAPLPKCCQLESRDCVPCRDCAAAHGASQQRLAAQQQKAPSVDAALQVDHQRRAIWLLCCAQNRHDAPARSRCLYAALRPGAWLRG